MTPKADYVFEPLKYEYTAQMAEIEKVCFTLPWSKQTLDEDVENPLAKYFVCISCGKVIGYIGSRFIIDEIHITNVAVIPERRHEGIATDLIRAMLDFAAEQKCVLVTLEVRQGNVAARRLYEKMGFQTVGLRPRYYFNPVENAVLMTKYLENRQ